MKAGYRCATSMFTLILCTATAWAIPWENARKISDGETTKSMDVYGASDGGCHVKWCADIGGPWSIRYRRIYADGTMGAITPVYTANGLEINGDIIEAGNGDLFVTWEDWVSNVTVRTARSSDNGATWTSYNIGGEKYPQLCRVGTNPAKAMVNLWNPPSDSCQYAIWNGSSWTSRINVPDTYQVGEYWVTGCAWSPYDGRVWKTFGRETGGWNLYVKDYNDATGTWGPTVQMTTSSGFFAWPAVAANEYGQVLVIWEDGNSSVWIRVYTPGSGWTAPVYIAQGRLPAVTSIPGNPEFYITYVPLPSQDRLDGHVVLNGVVGARETVSNNLAGGYTVYNSVSADALGNIHAVWEYWGNDKPETYYNRSTYFYDIYTRPLFESVSVSQSPLTADGTTEYQASLTCSNYGGVSSLRDMRIMFNFNTTDTSQNRGYLIWGLTQADVMNYGGTVQVMGAAGGEGYWGFDTQDWGHEYITPAGCTSSTAGNERTVTWTFQANRKWGIDGPATGNYIGMFARNDIDYNGWETSSTKFNYTFNVTLSPLPDYDEDTDVDMVDFAWLQSCITGQASGIVPAGCSDRDMDKDNDVDIYDVAKFSLCATAPGIPGDPNCAQLPVTTMVPDLPFNPSPANTATGIDLDQYLSWSAGTGATSHKVYFGSTNPPAYQTTIYGTLYNPGQLVGGITYYWQIEEVNDIGSTLGPVWSFTTTNALISNLNRYATGIMDIGSEYYGDRTYTILSMPASLQGELGIKTNNGDKENTSGSWITFDLNNQADIYIAYDHRGIPANGGTLPSWLSTWTDTGQEILVSDAGAYAMHLFKKTHNIGPVTLGGNKQSPASGSGSMYFVILQPTGN